MRFLVLLLVAAFAFVGFTRALECNMCQFAFSVTEDLVYQNASYTDIMPALSSACSYHSEEFAETCHEVVDTLGFALMNKATEQADSLAACQELGVCEVENDLLFKKKWHIKPHKWNPFKKLKCSACKHIVKAVAKSANKGTDQGKSFAHSECKALGKPLAHVCNKLVDKIFHKVVAELNRNTDTSKVCHKLHMCK